MHEIFYGKKNSSKNTSGHQAPAAVFRVSDWTGYPMEMPCSARFAWVKGESATRCSDSRQKASILLGHNGEPPKKSSLKKPFVLLRKIQ